MRARNVISTVCGVAALAAGLLSAGIAGAAGFPNLTGRVVDEAGILSESFERELTDELRRHEKAIGDQVVVVTMPTLSGRTIENFGRDLGNHWGLGRRNGDRAVILIVAPNDRRVRIEVARGLRIVLSDEIAQEIVDRDILPKFRMGDYEHCILMGVGGILHALEQGRIERDDGNRAVETGLVLFVVLGILVVLFLMIRSAVARNDKNREGQGGSEDAYFDYGADYSDGGGSFDGGGASGGDGH